jgi:SAM-dependent methyltransferase
MLVWLAVAVVVVLMAVSTAITVHLVVAAINGRVAAWSVPTPLCSVPEILEAVDLPERGVLYEPGCGDGRVLAAALRRWPGMRAVGVDNDPVMLGVARVWTRGRAKLELMDLMKLDFREADRVFVYLGPRFMGLLEPKFKEELRPGARVVSLQFPLPNRKVTREAVLERGRPYAERMYIYDY